MMEKASQRRQPGRTLARVMALVAVGVFVGSMAANGQDFDRDWDQHFRPGNLVVSRSVYDNKASNVRVGTVLPPNCASTQGGCSASTGAPYNGLYPYVWNNDVYDGSFGITSKIFLTRSLLMAG